MIVISAGIVVACIGPHLSMLEIFVTVTKSFFCKSVWLGKVSLGKVGLCEVDKSLR